MSWYSEKFFPVINNLVSRSFVNHRKKVLLDAKGEMVEIGFGSGLSIDCYPSSVEKIVGVEPSKGMISRIKKTRSTKVELVEGFAEDLLFDDERFDGAVSFLTLCSVEDLEKSIKEMHRVLKPGGKLFFIEHVAQPKQLWGGKLQIILEPIWKKIACGCHLRRDITGFIENLGFKMIENNPIIYGGFPNFLGPVYRGIAQKTISM